MIAAAACAVTGFAVSTSAQNDSLDWHTLTIVPSAPGQGTISWTPDTLGWLLQETLSLSPASWEDAPSGSTNNIVVPATLPAKFYRLHQP